MSEQWTPTTDQVRIRGGKQASTAEMINHELAARWEMCCEAVGIDTDATAAEWREAYEAKRAQAQREAAEPHLRRKWADEARKLLNMRADFQGPHATARNRGIHDVIYLLEGAGE